MKINPNTLAAFGLVLVAVVATIFTKKPDTRAEPSSVPREAANASSEVPIRTANHRATSRSASKVLRRSPEDWKRLFEEEYQTVPREDQHQILELAGQLDHALSTGGDPESPSAQVYVDAITILLNESQSANTSTASQ